MFQILTDFETLHQWLVVLHIYCTSTYISVHGQRTQICSELSDTCWKVSNNCRCLTRAGRGHCEHFELSILHRTTTFFHEGYQSVLIRKGKILNNKPQDSCFRHSIPNKETKS